MKQLKILNPENVSEDEVKEYTTRAAARAIVVDENKNIALLYVSKKGYYKLPGGGIEDSEDPAAALIRECQEEIGCDIEVMEEVGSIIEYRKIFNLKQTSYCYLVKVQGKKGNPKFTEAEVEDGFDNIWLPYEQVLKALSQCRAITFEGSAYIVPRDIIFLEEAKNYLINFGK